MTRLAPLLALLFVACTTTTSAGSSSPTASASPSPSRGPVACKLPLAAGGAPISGPAGGGTTGAGGFVTIPGGTFAADPASQGAYDHQQSRWLPTSYRAVSPDGSRYAYAEPAGAAGGPQVGVVHIVNVSSGVEMKATTPGPVGIDSWTASGIYVYGIIPQSDAGPIGLTVIDPATQQFRQITPSGEWLVVGDRYAYSTDVDPADPHPPVQTGPGRIPGDRVVRLDVTTGAVTPVVTVNGATVEVLGLDTSGNPIVSANTSTSYSVRLTPSNTQIFSGPAFDNSPASTGDPLTALADATGIWFSSIAGQIWHYGPGDTVLQAVSATGLGFPALAGPCT